MLAPSMFVLGAIRIVFGAEALIGIATGNAPAIFVALSALTLTFLPGLLAQQARLLLPPSFLAAIAVFVLASIYLGELHDFYNRLWWWDLALHAGSAMGFGILGFLFVSMLFEGDRYAAPPYAIGILSFCLAMTVGVLWEIFEYAMDSIFGFNMQKSGLQDTMGDLIVNAVGALVAALAGVAYVSGRRGWHVSGAFEAFITANRPRFRKLMPRRKSRPPDP